MTKEKWQKTKNDLENKNGHFSYNMDIQNWKAHDDELKFETIEKTSLY